MAITIYFMTRALQYAFDKYKIHWFMPAIILSDEN